MVRLFFFSLFFFFLSYLARAGAENVVKIWSPETGEFLRDLIGHTQGLSDIAWSSNSVNLASASDDTTIRIWNVQTVGTSNYSPSSVHENTERLFYGRVQHINYSKVTASGFFASTTTPLQTFWSLVAAMVMSEYGM